MAVLGIDIGTQSLKVVAADDHLNVVGEASVAYQPAFPRPGWAEQDVGLWESALAPAIAGALAHAGLGPALVRAIGFGGQLDGCVAVDDQGAALAPALIWMDRRADSEVLGIDPELVRSRAGVVLDATHMAAKIRWLRRHEPRAARARWFHQPVSYLVARLTGEHVFDHGLASTTMLYALVARDWDADLLAAFDIDAAQLPVIAEAAAAAGRLGTRGAALTGLYPGTIVAVGTGDDFTNPLGAGVVAPGRAVCTIGTAEVVGAVHDRPAIDPDGLVETHGYVGPTYFIENPGWLSGGAVTWLHNLLAIADAAALDARAAEAPAGADGVTFLPALSGAMAPEWIASARGCFYGLTAAHGAPHLARALLEGCAFAMRDVIDRLDAMGAAVGTIMLLGGGARSRLWASIRADVMNRPVEVAARTDASAVGGAVLAAVAAGLYPDLAQAAARVGRIAAIVEPRPDRVAAYANAYDAYRLLFDSLRPMYARA
ncbi:MAG: xylulokinase [Alphaproteobacteria bacterium]